MRAVVQVWRDGLVRRWRTVISLIILPAAGEVGHVDDDLLPGLETGEDFDFFCALQSECDGYASVLRAHDVGFVSLMNDGIGGNGENIFTLLFDDGDIPTHLRFEEIFVFIEDFDLDLERDDVGGGLPTDSDADNLAHELAIGVAVDSDAGWLIDADTADVAFID